MVAPWVAKVWACRRRPKLGPTRVYRHRMATLGPCVVWDSCGMEGLRVWDRRVNILVEDTERIRT